MVAYNILYGCMVSELIVLLNCMHFIFVLPSFYLFYFIFELHRAMLRSMLQNIVRVGSVYGY